MAGFPVSEGGNAPTDIVIVRMAIILVASLQTAWQ